VFRRLAFVIVLVLLPLLPAAPAHALPLKCQRESVPVHLSAANSTVYQLVGWTCSKGSSNHKPVEILVPGFTYDHTYWDFPLQPLAYSYVQAATDGGNVTFAVDRLGTGQSSHPPSTLLTASATPPARVPPCRKPRTTPTSTASC
jgi:hypothetical protein